MLTLLFLVYFVSFCFFACFFFFSFVEEILQKDLTDANCHMIMYDHISSICRKVSAQISALNRLKNILPLKTKESLYRGFILPYFNYCNQIWHHCGKRNT